VKYADRDNMVKGLRELADFIEERGPELPWTYPDIKITNWVYEKEDAKRATKALAKWGIVQKVWTGSYLDIRRKFGKAVTLEFTISRDNSCVRREVGEKVIEEQIIPARVEKVYEYDCDPILS
jgi:hypothetical protein